MGARELVLPPDFSEYEWEVKAKGVFWEARVQTLEGIVDVMFYDQVRLAQDVAEELERAPSWGLRRTLVVREVTLQAMKDAVARAPEEFFE